MTYCDMSGYSMDIGHTRASFMGEFFKSTLFYFGKCSLRDFQFYKLSCNYFPNQVKYLPRYPIAKKE